MRTIAHISDLHFGTEIPEVMHLLRQELTERKPDLLVISGDLTQRARRAQYRAARDYVETLPEPRLIVPGNHDVPLYDVVRRFASPLTRYREFICSDLDPVWEDDAIYVAGVNTARSFTWKNGRISVEQIEQLDQRLKSAGRKLKVVVTHHPFIPPPHDVGIDLVGRAAMAIPMLEKRGVDLLLAGHLHHGYAGDIRAHYPLAKRSVIAAQAGTAISGRMRGEPNGYNWIRLSARRISIEVRVWRATRFSSDRVLEYQLGASGWEVTPETIAAGPKGQEGKVA